ncbi:ATP-binding cassette subfamily B multidrug efflux pump [Breznakia blatticola]|uniref:ATP-binding cassette subfamily B multidrug efflux pump n=1 Tax=Breznakia blatticola TaxID=1754012 RepID=A0A4V6Q8K4_9FIRM|nr:ABC transporter ATP-binding protein [Breznakia blatticola]TDW25497.1 ATP-binding cassette subfamily B multidrug efflux pump [Breznakia blatticola]
MKFLWKYLRRYSWILVLNFVGIAGFIIAELGIPSIVAQIVDKGIRNHDVTLMKTMLLYLVLIAICGGVGRLILSFCGARMSSYVVRDIRNDIFKKTQTYSPREYNMFGVSSMITRTNPDAYMLMQFTNMLMRTGLLTPVMIVASFFMVIKTSQNLAMVIIGSLPIIIFSIYLIAKASGPLSKKQQKEMDNLNRITRENITGVRVIRAFRKNKYEEQRFSQTSEDYTNVAKKLFKLMAIGQPLFFFILNSAGLIIYWVGSNLIDAGNLQVGQLMAFGEYMFHALFSLMLFSNMFMMYPRAKVSADRIEEMLNVEVAIQNPSNPVFEGKEDTTLVFDQVSFQYPDGELPVLQNISFEAHKGQTVAFIGSTGSGKSTLINLIPRFYDVSAGNIKVDGVDVRKYDIKTLRQKIGFIPQKALLFSGTIKENIKYGKHDASEDEVVASSKVANAYEFIQDKPQQFEDCIAESGTNVSGGQRQRLSIARAVVRKPEIYIFDDSFSALDFKTDAEVRKNLLSETEDAITLIVAQRVSSIMNADQIIVLNNGTIVGKGTHRELLETCEIYQEIARSQLSEKELAL